MRKIISLLVLVLLVFGLAGCKEEPQPEPEVRTYMADGTYMVWEFGMSQTDLLMEDPDNPGQFVLYINPDTEAKVRVNTPVLSTVKVLIHNDEIVSYEIDELQSKAYVGKTRQGAIQIDENGYVTGVTWVFNEQTKRQLEYGYNMHPVANNGEWYAQIIRIENEWLKNEPQVVSSATITHAKYVTMAQRALQNAKDGKIGAVIDREHYSYDVTYVTGDIDEDGKISNIALDAFVFGKTVEGTYNPESEDYLKFSWYPESKYEYYPVMRNELYWQDMVDTFVDYINENGWDGSINAGSFGDSGWVDKGVHVDGDPIEALSSVTIQLSRHVYVLNMLLKFFPYGWE